MERISLKDARQRVRLSQTALAQRSGLSQTYISDLESGKQHNPTIEAVARLERALGLKRGALLFGETVEIAAPPATASAPFDRRRGAERRMGGRRRENRLTAPDRRKEPRRG